jgi:hypothetical protein
MNKPYMVCVGAAQAFGPFCEKPFPILLMEKLGIQVLNLGLAGAIPAQFLNRRFLRAINNSKLAIIQVLSGRCGSNSRYTSVANQLGIMHDNYKIVPPEVFWQYAEKEYRKRLINKLVKETRQDYLCQMLTLIQSIKIPRLLFYISTHKPEDLPDKMTESPFPHFLRRWMLDKMAEFCDEYVEYVSSKGLPQRLYDKNGKPTTVKRPHWDTKRQFTTHNRYYPSPEMQADAAELLAPVCRKMLTYKTAVKNQK